MYHTLILRTSFAFVFMVSTVLPPKVGLGGAVAEGGGRRAAPLPEPPPPPPVSSSDSGPSKFGVTLSLIFGSVLPLVDNTGSAFFAGASLSSES